MSDAIFQQRYTVDSICDMIRNEKGQINVKKFLWVLTVNGIRKSDPRLKGLMANLRQHLNRNKSSKDNAGTIPYLATDEFKEVIASHLPILDSILRRNLIIPEWKEFCDQVLEIYVKCKDNNKGKVADYIPQLARVDPNYFAVSICTVDGQRYSHGDHKIPFSVQSTSKPINYAIALNTLGSVEVHKYVGQEPSGRVFNEVVLDENNKPHNPMINAGAITVCSLLKRGYPAADRFDEIFRTYEKMAGGEYIGFSNAVYLSECDTADRNFALAYFLRENHCFPEGTDLKETLELYFQLCSVEANCDSLSVIAATFANGGICPTTNEQVIDSSCIQHVLSLMHSCGMYDYSGQFSFKVGLPAKSGVSGAIMVVVPNVMGICLWAPPLDVHGNSCRGVEFCEEFIKKFNFHVYDNIRHTPYKLDPRKRNTQPKNDIEKVMRRPSLEMNHGDLDFSRLITRSPQMLHPSSTDDDEVSD